MPIPQIENLAKTLATKIIAGMKTATPNRCLIKKNSNEDLSGYPDSAFDHRGLYGFCIEQNGKSAVVYIGKSEQDTRLRQHLTGKNKNGTVLADSVGHKNKRIKEAIENGFLVYLCLYTDAEFGKASLSCIEIASALHAKSDMKKSFPQAKHWNVRIG